MPNPYGKKVVVHQHIADPKPKLKPRTQMSVYMVSQVALELSRQPDGTVKDFEQNMERAYLLLKSYEERLADIGDDI